MDYIEEIMDTPPATDEVQETEVTSEQDESIEASTEEVETAEETTLEEETPQKDETEAKIAELQAELAKAEGRMSEKDRYINELRNQNSKKKDEPAEETKEDEGFWDDPEAVVSKTQQTVQQLQFELAETKFATKNPDYYDIVNVDAVNLAMAQDKDFADRFSETSDKIGTAYTYLKEKSLKQAEESQLSAKELKEQMRAEILAELKVKPKKEVPASVSGIGHSHSSKSDVPDDGFSAMFGESL